MTQKGLEEQLLGGVIQKEQKSLEEQLKNVLEEVRVMMSLFHDQRVQGFAGHFSGCAVR